MKGQSGLAVRARGLAKSYGKVKAVKSIDLELRRGEIYGFLGRNGAGKTTTVRMLLGLIRPDSGEMSVLGSSLKEDRTLALSRVCYLVESAAAYPSLTVWENLDIQRRLTRSPRGAVGEAMELMRIAQYADRKASALSMATSNASRSPAPSSRSLSSSSSTSPSTVSIPQASSRSEASSGASPTRRA